MGPIPNQLVKPIS